MSSIEQKRDGIEENYRSLVDSVQEAAVQADRDPENVKLIGVTKGFDAEIFRIASSLGLNAVGENRVKTAVRKKDAIPERLRESLQWHMIGHVQSNKVKHLLDEFDLIHSVDRQSLVNELDKRLTRQDLEQDVLVQVNTSGEDSKYGIQPDKAPGLLEDILEISPLNVRGLMTMAPLSDDSTRLREVFSNCRTLRNDLEDRFGVRLPELSMGMTNDYREAVLEGSTMLRVGRGIFGERPG
ncbi:MAG: YggS family pyridoxal phosphate-dependent enzyme [bacterium]